MSKILPGTRFPNARFPNARVSTDGGQVRSTDGGCVRSADGGRGQRGLKSHPGHHTAP